MGMEVFSIYEFFLRMTRDYFSHGYFYYYLVPKKQHFDEKRLQKIETKLYQFYKVTSCRTRRHRRKKQGLANCVVLRYKQEILILATEGEHENLERQLFSDIRTTPLRFAAHEVYIQGFRENGLPDATVRMTWPRVNKIKKILKVIELHRRSKVIAFYQSLSPYPFDGVNLQKLNLLKRTNRRRRRGGLGRIRWTEIKPKWMYEKTSKS